jgi:hypothetical protein
MKWRVTRKPKYKPEYTVGSVLAWGIAGLHSFNEKGTE